jgi:putative membrane protein
MKKILLAMVAVVGVGTALTVTTGGVMAAGSASDADKAFVGKVSQGGAYEVEAGKVAAMRGTTPFIRDFGVMETHDHMGVGAGLKKAAAETGVPIAPGLNAEFSARLAKLKSVPADKFDSFYLDDMKQIHNKDEGLFVQESKEGTGPYKEFCHETAVLVKAHLGWLNTM